MDLPHRSDNLRHRRVGRRADSSGLRGLLASKFEHRRAWGSVRVIIRARGTARPADGSSGMLCHPSGIAAAHSCPRSAELRGKWRPLSANNLAWLQLLVGRQRLS